MKLQFFFIFFLFVSAAFAQSAPFGSTSVDQGLLNKAAQVLDKKVNPPGSKGSATQIGRFAEGPSSTEQDFLNKESFAPVETQRLKNATVAWLNYDLLRDLGFKVPAEGLTPELEKAVLDAFAYIVPNDKISPDKFLPIKKTFYADRYGGSGTGYAEGSGRAAAAGMFQTKGIGRTPLAEELKKKQKPILTWNPKTWNPFEIYKNIKNLLSEIHHSHGGATLREGLAEAIWGEILQRELPYGSNRVLAVIMTDLSIGAFGESRALIIRENSLRPAHFIQTEKGKDFFTKKEAERISRLSENLKSFILSFVPQDYGTEAERFVLGQKILVHRITRKFAAEYSHSLFHGSTSPSNIDLRGTALDLGPMTALAGFEKALFADDYPNGDIRNIKETILFELFDDLKSTMSDSLKKSVLSRPKISSIIRSTFEENVNKELLWFSGVPNELMDEVWKHEEARDFSKNLRNLIEAENDTLVNVRFKVDEPQGKYDVREILKILSLQAQLPEEAFLNKLEKEIPNTRTRNRVLNSFNQFQKVLSGIAVASGYSSLGFIKYQSAAANIRNQKLTSLMRGMNYFFQFFSEIWKYRILKNRETIFSFVNRVIDKNRRYWFNSSPKTLVIAEKKHHESGAVLQHLIDGKTGAERIELVAPTDNDSALLFGKKVTLSKLKNGQINLVLGKVSLPISSINLGSNQVSINFNSTNLPLDFKNLIVYSQVSFVESKAAHSIIVDLHSPAAKENVTLDNDLEEQAEKYINEVERGLQKPTVLSCDQVFLAN